MIPGENIDTTRHAGTQQEHSAAWSNRALKHLPEMRVLRAAGILGPENRDWRNVAEHLLVVNAVAMLLASKLAASGVEIDLDLVDKASILHDATKRLDKEAGVSYATEQTGSVREAFLASFGYEPDVVVATGYTGRVPEIFIEGFKEQRFAIEQLPLENLVVAYADARVRNTDVVNLEQARDLNKQKVPDDAAIYDQWHAFYKTVEDRIAGLIVGDPSFDIEAIANDDVIGFVQQATF